MESVCDVASISTFTSLSPSTLSVTVTFPPPNPSAVALAVLTSASAVAQAIVSTIHRLSSSAVSFFMMKNPFPFLNVSVQGRHSGCSSQLCEKYTILLSKTQTSIQEGGYKDFLYYFQMKMRGASK